MNFLSSVATHLKEYVIGYDPIIAITIHKKYHIIERINKIVAYTFLKSVLAINV